MTHERQPIQLSEEEQLKAVRKNKLSGRLVFSNAGLVTGSVIFAEAYTRNDPISGLIGGAIGFISLASSLYVGSDADDLEAKNEILRRQLAQTQNPSEQK